MQRTPLVISCSLMLLLTACSGWFFPPPTAVPTPPFYLVTVDPSSPPTPTPFQPLPASTPANLTSPPTSTPFLVSPTIPPSPIPDQPVNPINRAQYIFYVVMDYAAHHLSVSETALYTNKSDETLSNLVLAVEPNDWQNCFFMSSLVVGEVSSPDYILDGYRLEVNLPQPLPPGGSVRLDIRYDLALPYKSYAEIFGFNSLQADLVNWFPYIVPYSPGQGWLLHEPSNVGEHLVYEASDFEVNLRFKDLLLPVVVASGALGEASGEWTRYRLYSARTFTFSASTEFIYSSTNVGSVLITSYYYPWDQVAGEAVLGVVVKALSLFNQLYASYPYASLSIVETNCPDGQEFDGLFFLSQNFYSEYNSSVTNNLSVIAVHETAHQWWFGLVGNDQALEPWLDEALSTYSERIFYENAYPGLVVWWWGFRVNSFQPSGWVDADIYNGGDFRPYTNSVYLRGAQFLEDLRSRIGDDAFFSFVRGYATQMAYQRASTTDFFTVMRQHTTLDVSGIVRAYFQHPQ